MTTIDSQTVVRGLRKSILAVGIALCLLFATTLMALANTVYIGDAAHVLDQNQVKDAASKLPDPVSIYTTSTFNGTTTQFDQQARSHITNPNTIVIAIDTTHRHLAIVGGSNVPLSSSQYQDAVTAFKNNFKGGDYTAATVATLNTLRQNLGAAPVAPGNGNNNSSNSNNGGGFFSSLFLPLCCIGLVLAIVLLVTEKENRFVKFHAIQSLFLAVAQIAVSLIMGILTEILGIVLGMVHLSILAFFLNWGLGIILLLIFAIVWIIAGIKAYGGQWYKLPLIGNFAWNTVNK